MAVHVLDAMAREGFEEVVALHDGPSGLRAFLGLHDTSAGPAFGGIRRFTYRDERTALIDCLRLSKAMSHKCALAEVPGGGGKLVVMDRPELVPDEAYRRIGERIEGLGGRYYAGPDVGTGRDELGWVAEGTSFVTPPGPDGPGDLARATAAGVFSALAAALRFMDGEEDWAERTVVIQGLGHVGAELARRLTELGASVRATELDPERRAAVESRLGIEMLEPGTEFDCESDVFSPCAMGGILHDLTIQRLRTRVVCGAANNVLAGARHGESLASRGILYVPDVVANSGALIRGAAFHLQGRSTSLDEVERRLGSLTARVLEVSAAEGKSPARVAHEDAERMIRARRRRLRPSTPSVAVAVPTDDAALFDSTAR